MLYVFGGDENKSRARLRAALESLVKRAPHAHVMRITDEDVEQTDVGSLLSVQGLFYAKRIVIFDNALKEKSAQKTLLPYMGEMAQSGHVFFILQESLTMDMRKQLTAHATKAELAEQKEQKGKPAADWSATNALERRDGNALWIAIVKALLGGASPEQVHGQLFWKAKQMVLERRFRGWDEAAAKELLGALAELPHEARRKGVEMEYALERFSLSI